MMYRSYRLLVEKVPFLKDYLPVHGKFGSTVTKCPYHQQQEAAASSTAHKVCCLHVLAICLVFLTISSV